MPLNVDGRSGRSRQIRLPYPGGKRNWIILLSGHKIALLPFVSQTTGGILIAPHRLAKKGKCTLSFFFAVCIQPCTHPSTLPPPLRAAVIRSSIIKRRRGKSLGAVLKDPATASSFTASPSSFPRTLVQLLFRLHRHLIKAQKEKRLTNKDGHPCLHLHHMKIRKKKKTWRKKWCQILSEDNNKGGSQARPRTGNILLGLRMMSTTRKKGSKPLREKKNRIVERQGTDYTVPALLGLLRRRRRLYDPHYKAPFYTYCLHLFTTWLDLYQQRRLPFNNNKKETEMFKKGPLWR